MTSEPFADDGQEPTAGEPWSVLHRVLEAGIDFDRANAARMYDHFLGGGHNFAVDREVAGAVAATARSPAYPDHPCRTATGPPRCSIR